MREFLTDFETIFNNAIFYYAVVVMGSYVIFTLLSAIETMSDEELHERFSRADRYLRDAGVFYRAYGSGGSSERAWPFSHIPVMISEAEWQVLADGLPLVGILCLSEYAGDGPRHRAAARRHVEVEREDAEWSCPRRAEHVPAHAGSGGGERGGVGRYRSRAAEGKGREGTKIIATSNDP